MAAAENDDRNQDEDAGTGGKRQRGGFTDNPDLAREAGKKGGDLVKERHGREHYERIGRQGGEALRESWGWEFLPEIGRRGGVKRGQNAAEKKASEPPPEPKPKRPRGRPRKSPPPGDDQT